VVVFTDPLCELRIGGAQVAAVRFSELLPLVSELGRSRRMAASLARDSARSLAGLGKT
jgi:hypothetical protein